MVSRLQAEVSEEQIVRLTRELVRIPSVTGSEAAVFECAEEWLTDQGLKCKTLARVDDRPNLVVGSENGARPLLVFNGHLDTVPVSAGESWDVDPLAGVAKGGCLYGRGTLDMKGACAAMMHVLAILKRSGADFEGRVQLQLVCDEEKSSYYGTRYLIELMNRGELTKPDYVLVGEKSSLKIRAADRGSFPFRLQFKGRAAHTGMARVLGINPIVHAAEFIRRLDRPLSTFHPAVGHPVVSVNCIEGGTVTNQVPAVCTITVDRRLVPGESKESVIAQVEQLLAEIKQEIPELECELKPIKTPDGRDEFSAPNMTPLDHPIVSHLRTAYRAVLGREAELFVDWGGGTDARMFREAGVPALVFGACGSGHHGENEHVAIESLVTLARVYLAMAGEIVAAEY